MNFVPKKLSYCHKMYPEQQKMASSSGKSSGLRAFFRSPQLPIIVHIGSLSDVSPPSPWEPPVDLHGAITISG